MKIDDAIAKRNAAIAKRDAEVQDGVQDRAMAAECLRVASSDTTTAKKLQAILYYLILKDHDVSLFADLPDHTKLQ